MKIRYKCLALISVLFFTILFVYKYGYVDLVASRIRNYNVSQSITMIEKKLEDTSDQENLANFSFRPERNLVSGFILYGRKFRYSKDEEDRLLRIHISYQMNNDNDYNKDYEINISELQSRIADTDTIYRFKIEPLKKCKNKVVNVSVWGQKNDQDQVGLKIFNEIEDISQNPKVLYRVTVQDLLEEVRDNFDKDHRFFVFYAILISLLSIALFCLIIFDIHKNNK